MRVYRGTRDILPHDLDHRRLSPAVYGTATYYALHESDGHHYSQGGYSECQVVVTYDLPVKNVLTITDQDWDEIGVISDAKKPLAISKKLQDHLEYQLPELIPVNLAKVAHQSGFDAVVLQGVIEGGQQVVVPENEIVPQVVSMQVKMAKDLCGYNKAKDTTTQFIKILELEGIVVTESHYYLEFTLTPGQVARLAPVFEFLKTTKRKHFYAVDFTSLKIEPYEDDEY
jgi:hypothetical protein